MVEDYRAAHGLTRGRDTTLLQDEVTQVNSAQSAARQQRIEAEAALAGIDNAQRSSGLENLAGVVGSPLIQKLREQEALIAGHLAELESRNGPNSPLLAPIKAELSNLHGTIELEIKKIAESLRGKITVAKSVENATNAELIALKKMIALMDNDLVPLRALEGQAAVDRDLYSSFLARFKATDPWLEYPAGRVRILSLATPPAHASFPNKILALPVAVAISISLAVTIALLLSGRHSGLFSMSDVDQYLGVPPLGLLPLRRRRFVLQDGIFREAISHLFERLVQRDNRGLPSSIVITSAVPGEGKSTTALALAREGAARGLKVLLIDGDLRSRLLSTHKRREIAGSGMSEVLRGTISVDEAVRYSTEFGVPFLAAGSPSGIPDTCSACLH